MQGKQAFPWESKASISDTAHLVPGHGNGVAESELPNFTQHLMNKLLQHAQMSEREANLPVSKRKEGLSGHASLLILAKSKPQVLEQQGPKQR